MNWNVVFDQIGLLLVAILSAGGLYARARIEDWAARQRLEGALGRAAGLVLSSDLVQKAGSAAVEMSVGIGIDYLDKSIPGSLARLGVSPDRLKRMLVGEVFKTLGSSSIGQTLGGVQESAAVEYRPNGS